MAIGGVKLQREALKQMAPATTYVDTIYLGPTGTVTIIHVPAGASAVSFGYELPGAWMLFGDYTALSGSTPAFPVAVSVEDGTGWAYAPTSRSLDSSITGIAVYNKNASVAYISCEWFLG